MASATNPKVDGYIRKNKRWQEELQALRTLILECGLTEEIKWRVPCYTLNGKNVVFLGAFKESAVLSFVKGVLLKDAKRILIQQTENSQSVRIIRFANVQEIDKKASVLKSYIREAAVLEKAGAKVTLKKITEYAVPEEFQSKLDESPKLKAAYEALTPGRRRGYLFYFSSAKQSQTRAARVEKYIPQILSGKGMDD